MRRKQFWAAVLALACTLVWSGCAVGQENKETGIVLYFLTDSETGHGPALGTQPCELLSPDPGELMSALLAGPTQEGLTTPFPNGVTLQSWEWDEELDGNIKVRLSEQYSDLTDISLTLADYCIVLTLTQIDGVESVELISNSYSASYRSHQILTADEVLLS